MSSVRLMVLGVLSTSEVAHGYTMYRQINGWRAETWTDVKPGSIYHALTYLQREGYIENAGRKKDSGGPAATSYRINSKGMTELRRLVSEALVSYDQEEFTAGLAWMQVLPRAEVLSLARQRLKNFTEACQFMRTLPQDEHPVTPDKHPAIIGSWMAILDATAEWLRVFVAHIESGQYRFSDEREPLR